MRRGWLARCFVIAVYLAFTPAAPAQPAPAPPASPNLTIIRATAPVSAIDRQNVQTWVEAQFDQLFASAKPDTDGAKVRTQLLEHFEAGNATPDFKTALAQTVTAALTKRYTGKTSPDGSGAPRPLAVVHPLLLLNTYGDVASLDIYKQALTDDSSPGVRVAAARGLIGLRDKMSGPQWAALILDVAKAAKAETDPIAIGWMVRLLKVNNPQRAQQVAPVMAQILADRCTRFEQKEGAMPAPADRDAAAWLGPQGIATQNNQLKNDITLSIARLLADAVFVYTQPQTTPGRKDDLAKIIPVAEQQLKAIATNRAPNKPQPDVAQALQAAVADQTKKMTAELEKWIGTATTPGFLNAAPFAFPAGLGIQRPAPTTSTAPSP